VGNKKEQTIVVCEGGTPKSGMLACVDEVAKKKFQISLKHRTNALAASFYWSGPRAPAKRTKEEGQAKD
jgi:hypothetical protein